MRALEQILAGLKDWAQFETAAAGLAAKQQGDLFELLTKHYLLLNPVHGTELSDVWLLEEVPQKVRAALKLPEPDKGIDLIAKTKSDEYWAIQCKYRTDKKRSLSWRELSTFTGLAFSVCKGITHALVAHTGERYTKVLQKAEHVSFLSGEKWGTLEPGFFAVLRDHLGGKPRALVPITPRAHQRQAIDSAKQYFRTPGNVRGKIIMPCATGKSLTGFWIADALPTKTIVVALPSLALIEQTLPVWLREFSALGHAEGLRWLCVCSDETVAKDADSIIVHTQDLPYPCTTTVEDIITWLDATKTAKKRIIFTTYQSGRALADAMRTAGVAVDLAIMDEAHKTVGDRKRLFSHLLFDENLQIKRRVFMTATERRFAGDSDAVVSMDDPAIYGDTVELLTFKAALEQEPPIISDYKIISMVISQAEIEALVAQNRYLRPEAVRWDDEVEAQMLASLIALRKAMHKHPIRHAVSFHSSIARAKAFRDFNDIYTQALPNAGTLDTFHVTGAMPAAVRKGMMGEFATAPRGLVTNARCLTEGVDVPNIDCVLFADPKQSTIDIVQAVGRALRPADHKRCAYVLIPVIMQGTTGEAFVESKAFAAVLTVLRALATNDERIIAWFRARHAGRITSGGIVDFNHDENIAHSIDLGDFAAKIETKVWDRLAKLSWRSYDEAVKFVHILSLKNQPDWTAYCRGDRADLPRRPADIPANPAVVYGEEFRDRGGMGAWLGTGTVALRLRTVRSYEDDVKFVHGLGLKSHPDWRAYCRGERTDLPAKPADIPSDPWKVYENELRKRGGWGAWLGTDRRQGGWRPFDEAVKFVHTLALKSQSEWRAYCRRERTDLPRKPADIPTWPEPRYGEEFRKQGGWNAWLGTDTIVSSNRRFQSYDDAVRFVHALGLKSEANWRAFCRGERSDLPRRPADIPSNPATFYGAQFRDRGGIGAWLGAGNRKGGWRAYDDAVTFVQALGLKSLSDWQAYCRGERPDLLAKPMDIPANASGAYGQVFNDRGGLGAWLGTAKRRVGWRSYDDAVVFVHPLKIKGRSDWYAYCRGERPDLPQRPTDIPREPRTVYAEEFRQRGGWGAWVGTHAIGSKSPTAYRSYDEATKFVHALGLMSNPQWRAYCAGKPPDLPVKPTDIPANPRHAYPEFAERGGWGAWLRKA